MHGTASIAGHAPSQDANTLGRFASSRAVMAAIWLLFLVPRIAVLLIDVTPTSDAEWYWLRAVDLAAGKGYLDNAGQPTAFWPPGWPMALSLLVRLTGPSLAALGLFNLASAVLTGWLTLLVARRLSGSEAAARVALLLLAVYPNSVGYVPLALTEVFYTALLMCGCWLLLARRSAWPLIGAGAVFGLATLVKAQTPLVVPLIFAIDWLRGEGIWKRLPSLIGQGAVVIGVAALVVLPWTLRNHEQLGHWVAVSTNGGHTLLTGNNDAATGDYSPQAPVVTRLAARPGLGEVERDAEARKLALDWIADNPGKFLALAPRKLARLWLPDGEAEWAYQGGAPSHAAHESLYRAVRYANQAYYALLMAGFALAFLYFAAARRREAERWVGWWLLPYGIAAYPTIIAIAFSGQSRFHYTVMPFVCIALGWFVAELAARRQGMRIEA